MTINLRHVQRLVLLFVVACLITAGMQSVAPDVDVSTATPLVQVRTDDVPAYVWDAMLTAGAPSMGTDRCECLYVPQGATYGPVGSQWTATVTGMEPSPAN